MPASPQPLPDPSPGESVDALARLSAPGFPPILPAAAAEPSNTILPFAGASRAKDAARTLREPAGKKSQGKILRGLKDLQELQKQTIAVLEAVQGSLDDIQQVLRSPEATRGLEKQKNAATLLSKGFPREAVEQASGAAVLLPANPETHLLLALSLAADQQFDASLAATRKGLALIDRRNHPLAIEAGLLHALAALGCAAEAVERWSTIIDSLPLPVLLEQSGRIAACFPPATSVSANDATEEVGGSGHLDFLLAARLRPQSDPMHDSNPGPSAKAAKTPGRRPRLIDTAPDEIPAAALFAGLDAAEEAHLPFTHRAILVQIAQRLKSQRTSGDLLKFLSECLVPLGNRALDRATGSLARAIVKRLYQLHADAPTLYRAMEKLQMSGDVMATREVAKLLYHWRKASRRMTRMRLLGVAAAGTFVIGAGMLLWALAHGGFAEHAAAGGALSDPLRTAAGLMGVGIIGGLGALLVPAWKVLLPNDRPPLSAQEIEFLRTAAVGQALRGTLYATRSASSHARRQTQATEPVA